MQETVLVPRVQQRVLQLRQLLSLLRRRCSQCLGVGQPFAHRVPLLPVQRGLALGGVAPQHGLGGPFPFRHHLRPAHIKLMHHLRQALFDLRVLILLLGGSRRDCCQLEGELDHFSFP